MTIAFTRLFTTQGLVAGGLNEINTYRGTTLSARKVDLAAQLVTEEAYGPLTTIPYTAYDSAAAAENAYVADLSALALAALLADVEKDRPGAADTLAEAVVELRRQMVLNSETLNDCPGTVTVAAVGSPTGDHQFVFGVYEPKTGLKSDFLVPDVILVTCTADRSQDGTAYAETFSLVGMPADALPTDATYPSGSGVDTSVDAVDPATDESIVENGDFDTWTVTNTPDDWTLGSGTLATTHVFQKATDDVRGTAGENKSLRLVADGSVLIKLRQAVDLEPNTAYSVQFRLKKVSDPGTDWGVSLLLVDGAGTSVAGNGAYVNTITSATAGSVAASWSNPVTGVFLTPAVLPLTGLQVEIRFHQFSSLTTAAASTAECYVDHVSMIATEPLYDGGPTLTCFSGVTEGVVGDTRTATVALASGVPSTYLIRGMDRLLGLASLEDRIPTVAGGGETQADALVT